jgi:hypothetical protein
LLATGGPGLAAARQTPESACALAWNDDAKSSLRASVASMHPRGAFIHRSQVGIDRVTWTKSSHRSSSAQSRGCSIQFILRNGRTLALFGSWKDGSITRWVGPIASTKPIPVPDNTTVHADGTVGFHG